MARVSSRSGLVTASWAKTNPTRQMIPQLIPQEPVATPQHHHFCGHWARRNHPLPYTQGQPIIVTGVEDLPSAQPLPTRSASTCKSCMPLHPTSRQLSLSHLKACLYSHGIL